MRRLDGAHITEIIKKQIMTLRRIIYIPLRLLCLSALAAAFAGCLKENLDDCHYMTIQAYERGSDVELSMDNVKDLTLFVFDGDFRFMYKIETGVREKVTILRPKKKDLYIVAWGNLRQGAQTFTDPKPGDLLADCFVELKSRVRASETRYAGSPDDLFRGEISIASDDRRSNKILPLYREVGSMTITLRNMKAFTGYNDDDFSLAVRETFSMMDFSGRMMGDMIAYRPAGSFVNNGGREEYYVPPFNMFSNETGVHIDIFHSGDLVATISTDRKGNPVIVEKDKLTNVLIDLKTSVNVSIEITEWGRNYVWKEFLR
jgi:hypothetical protein